MVKDQPVNGQRHRTAKKKPCGDEGEDRADAMRSRGMPHIDVTGRGYQTARSTAQGQRHDHRP